MSLDLFSPAFNGFSVTFIHCCSSMFELEFNSLHWGFWLLCVGGFIGRVGFFRLGLDFGDLGGLIGRFGLLGDWFDRNEVSGPWIFGGFDGLLGRLSIEEFISEAFTLSYKAIISQTSIIEICLGWAYLLSLFKPWLRTIYFFLTSCM